MGIFKKIMSGLFLILIGVVLALNAFNITHINLLFNGWWTLFIIIPCVYGLFFNNDKVGNLIGLLAGVFLLLAANGLVEYKLILKLILPLILISLGISYIIGCFNTFKVKSINVSDGEDLKAVFSSSIADYSHHNFKGCKLKSVFASYELDLREAILKDDVLIEAFCIFGGISILVPKDIQVIVNSTNFFGGVNNEVVLKNAKKTIYVNSLAIFGGNEIKEK